MSAAGSAAGGGPRGRTATLAAIAGPALLAALLQGVRTARPGGILAAASYDTAVYLGSAIQLVHGVLPYRDFVLPQPGGLVIATLPFGLLSLPLGTRGALMAMGAWSIALAALDVILVGTLLRHRGWFTVLVACGLLAIHPAMYASLAQGQLEALMDLVCLAGLNLALRGDGLAGGWRLAGGGAVLAFGASILVAGVIPLLVTAATCATALRRRLLPFAGGAVAGLAVCNVPFLALAPSQFINDTVVTQLLRSSTVAFRLLPAVDTMRTPLLTRLEWMTFGGGETGALIAAAVIAVLILLGLAVVLRRPSPLGLVAAGSTLLLLGALLAFRIDSNHFPAMWAPFLALLVALAVEGAGRWVWPRRVTLAASAAGAAAVVAILVSGFEQLQWQDPRPYVDAAVPVGACTYARLPQYTLASDRFLSTDPACIPLLDTLAYEEAYSRDPAGLVGALETLLSRDRYLLINSPADQWLPYPWAAPVTAYLASHYRLVRTGRLAGGPPLYLYVRTG